MAPRGLGPLHLCAWLCLGCSTPPQAAEEAAPAAIELRPGVVVDVSSGLALVMSPRRQIDAIRLETGKVEWSTTSGVRPLWIQGNLLLAQAEPRAGTLELVVLDLNARGSRLFGATVPLPPPAQAGIEDGAGTAFRLRAQGVEGGASVEWTFSQRAVSTMPESEPRAIELAGRIRVDIAARRIDALPASAPGPSSPLLPAPVARLVAQGELTKAPWRAGKVLSFLRFVPERGGAKVSLRRWAHDSGEALPEVPLFGKELTFRYASADERHLLASRPAAAGAARPEPHFQWVIFSTETGARAAELSHERPGGTFMLHGDTVLVDLPSPQLAGGSRRHLSAIDIKTSAERWRAPVRDTSFQGSLPPSSPR